MEHPLAEKYVTAAEWARMVGAEGAEMPQEMLPLAFGLVMYEGDPEVVDEALSQMPAEARPVIRQLASEAFASHSERVHGTTTPPRSTEV